MSTAIYIVIFSYGQWWVDLEGKATGPFSNAEIAMSGAVSMASADARAGRRSEVRVSGPGHHNEIIYQSPNKSAVTRAGTKFGLAAE